MSALPTLAVAPFTTTPPPVAVTGPDRLTVHLICRVLDAAGVPVVDRADARVLVAVEPGPGEWTDLQAASLPLVLLVGNEPDADTLVDMIAAGARAVLPLDRPRQELADTIAAVAAGATVLSPAQVGQVADALQHRRRHLVTNSVTITARERDILLAIDAGQSVKQTARALGISPKTVENTQRLLFRKLGARNRAQAVATAHALGLMPQGD